jgi:biotin operon repressor
MPEIKSETPPAMRARKALLRLIEERKLLGSKLPPERDLAEKLKLSRVTLRKALGQLRAEGRIGSARPKGNYVLAAACALKSVLLVCGDGRPSGPLPFPEMFAEELDALAAAGCKIRFQHLRELAKAETAALASGADGVLWHAPSREALPAVRKLAENAETPLCCPTLIFERQGGGDSVEIPGATVVTMDYQAVGRLRAEACLREGARRVAYVGDSNCVSYWAFVATLGNAGACHGSELCADLPSDLGRELRAMDGEKPLDAVVSDGGAHRLEELFAALESLALGGRKPGLVVPSVPELPALRSRYPHVRLLALEAIPYREIGRRAAETLIASMNSGESLAGKIEIPPEMIKPGAALQSGEGI